MLALATWFLITGLGYPAPGWIPVVTLCLCIFCDASGLQPVCFVVLSELFAYQVSLFHCFIYCCCMLPVAVLF